jgi:hypothetical protein
MNDSDEKAGRPLALPHEHQEEFVRFMVCDHTGEIQVMCNGKLEHMALQVGALAGRSGWFVVAGSGNQEMHFVDPVDQVRKNKRLMSPTQEVFQGPPSGVNIGNLPGGCKLTIEAADTIQLEADEHEVQLLLPEGTYDILITCPTYHPHMLEVDI